MKKRTVVLGIALIAGALFTGCVSIGRRLDGKEPDTTTAEKEEGQGNTDSSQKGEGQVSGTEEEPQKDDVNTGEEGSNTTEARTVKLYYVDADTAEIKAKDVEIKDEFDLWNELVSTGLLTEECKLLSMTVDEGSSKMSVDINEKTGDLIRSMGTTGETEVIGCIINTYLDAYGCDSVLLTEEGGTLETSNGASFSSYSSRIEF